MTTPTPRRRNRDLTAFYAVVALIALAGQALAAVEWLGWPLLPAIAAVAALELGGVVLSRHALARMQLGERAIASRALSASVAGFAVAFNWLGHTDHRQGAFFAGMSALGYLVWLLDSAARRRDQLRTLDMLAVPPPAYGAAQWIRHPWLTREARALAVETPALGLHGSLAAAREARRRERRHAAIAVLLRRILSEGRDQVRAELAIATYNLDEIAVRLAAAADYDGLTALLGADLTAARVAGVEDTAADKTADIEPVADITVTAEDTAPATGDTAGGDTPQPRMATDTARLVAQSMFIANRDIALDIIAGAVGRDVRTVRRYLAQVGRPTSAPPAADGEPTGEYPIVRPLDPDAALAQLELDTVVDPKRRAHLAAVALFGPAATQTPAAISAAA